MLVQTYLAVMAGGAVGTALRMALSEWISLRFAPSFPLGTLVVNVTGCFVIGFFGGLTTAEGPLLVPPLLRQAIMIGVLGGYTTFSSFSLQTLTLATEGEWLYAGLNIALSVVLCLLAVWLGAISAEVLTWK